MPEVEIDGIAGGGAGVGRLPDGRVTFVHGTAPGESVEVRVVEERGRWTRAEAVRIVRPSPDRRPAPCDYYGRCGGCTLEHLRYAAQLEAKARIVADALLRIGGRRVETPMVVPSPVEQRYRNRVSFTLRRLAGGRVAAGFHALGRPGHIVDVDGACLLPEHGLGRAWGSLRRSWGPGAALLPAGDRLRLTLRAVRDGVTLLVEGGSDGGQAEVLADVVPLLSIWHRPEPGGAARLLAGAERVADEWRGVELELGATTFLQVNRPAAAAMEDHVVERVAAAGGSRVVDAYCGVGLTAQRLGEAGLEVIGIEMDEQAVEAARRRTGAARFMAGRVEDALPDALPADVVLVNPPRTGLAAAVPATLLSTPPRRLIYVSCDPATLARDLDRLGRAYALRDIRCFDLFPQTAHVETVVELEHATAASPRGD